MDRPVFDYSKLRGRIREKFDTQKNFADAMGTTPTTISLKLSSKLYFDQREVARAVKLLDIEQGSVSSYFFTIEPKKTKERSRTRRQTEEAKE